MDRLCPSSALVGVAAGAGAALLLKKLLAPAGATASGRIKLLYGDHPFWRAEAPRIALFIGGVEFEDMRVTREQRAAMKAAGELPFGQTPVLYVDDKPIAQTGGICRYVGKLGGLYPTDAFMAAKVDEVVDYATDITCKISPSMREKDPAKKLEMRKALAEEELPACFANLEKLLAANCEQLGCGGGRRTKAISGPSSFFVGDRLTIADLCVWRLMGWITGGVLDGVPADVAAPFPALCAAVAAVDQHPKVQEWKARHPKFYTKK